MIKIIKAKNYDEMSHRAANVMAAQITLKNDSVLGLATGSTPIGMYQELIRRYEAGDLDFSQVRSVNLDEYVGLGREHDQSYFYFMNEQLFQHVNIDKAQTFLPDGTNPDAEAECRRYHDVIMSMGGVDMQLLGIGGNGHIGFNEPAEAFAPCTHCVKLAESTIRANARFFASEDDVPRHAISMGIGEIMAAKKILILASGKAKAEAVKGMVAGPVTPQMPASILQFHPDVTLVADEEALSLLTDC